MTLTAERLRELLDYDPETGVFTWRVRNSNRALPGAVAGHRVARSNAVYRQVCVDRQMLYAHRLAVLWMTGEWPAYVDHRNGDGDDNRWANLRPCTATENACHRPRPRVGSSGYIGVSFYKPTQKWVAHVRIAGKAKNLGYYLTAEQAAQVRDDAARKSYGEFATLNFPQVDA